MVRRKSEQSRKWTKPKIFHIKSSVPKPLQYHSRSEFHDGLLDLTHPTVDMAVYQFGVSVSKQQESVPTVTKQRFLFLTSKKSCVASMIQWRQGQRCYNSQVSRWQQELQGAALILCSKAESWGQAWKDRFFSGPSSYQGGKTFPGRSQPADFLYPCWPIPHSCPLDWGLHPNVLKFIYPHRMPVQNE